MVEGWEGKGREGKAIQQVVALLPAQQVCRDI
jgi:hypothetical protein